MQDDCLIENSMWWETSRGRGKKNEGDRLSHTQSSSQQQQQSMHDAEAEVSTCLAELERQKSEVSNTHTKCAYCLL